MLATVNKILTFKDSRIRAFTRLIIAEGTAYRAHGARTSVRSRDRTPLGRTETNKRGSTISFVAVQR